MLKIFLGILGVIFVVALLTNNSSEKAPAALPAAPVTNQAASGNAGTAAAVNPPHGQPGHRCDIAVGAPLPSGPSAAAPGAAAPGAPAPNMAPVRKSASDVALNPAHGQPGHVCEVPVGRPLPKK